MSLCRLFIVFIFVFEKYPHATTQVINSSISSDKSRNGTSIDCECCNIKSTCHNKSVVCYLGNWSFFRPGKSKFESNMIDSFLCTHYIYAYACMDEKTNQLVSVDDWYDLGYKNNFFNDFTEKKKVNPNIKLLISTGSYVKPIKYSIMANDQVKREIFINSTIDFLKNSNLDGIDLNWVGILTGEEGSDGWTRPLEEEKENFVKFCREMKEKFNKINRSYILTITIPAKQSNIDAGYNITELEKYVDMFNVLTYDYFEFSNNVAEHHSLLYPISSEKETEKRNANYTITYLISKGASKNKLNLGIPTYGRSFKLEKQSETGFGAPASVNESFSQPYTQIGGFAGYNEICEILKEECWTINSTNLWTYIYKGNKWIGFDDIDNVAEKAKYVDENNLGGVMIWSIDTDDFHGNCHGISFPLVKTINLVLSHKNQQIKPKYNECRDGSIFWTIIGSIIIFTLAFCVVLMMIYKRTKNNVNLTENNIAKNTDSESTRCELSKNLNQLSSSSKCKQINFKNICLI